MVNSLDLDYAKTIQFFYDLSNLVSLCGYKTFCYLVFIIKLLIIIN